MVVMTVSFRMILS